MQDNMTNSIFNFTENNSNQRGRNHLFDEGNTCNQRNDSCSKCKCESYDVPLTEPPVLSNPQPDRNLEVQKIFPCGCRPCLCRMREREEACQRQVIGEAYKRGYAEGCRQGYQKGFQEGCTCRMNQRCPNGNQSTCQNLPTTTVNDDFFLF